VRTSEAAEVGELEQRFIARVRDWGASVDSDSVEWLVLAPHGSPPAGALPIGWWQAAGDPEGPPFPALFDEAVETIARINDYCWETTRRLTAGVGDALQEIHGTDHPPIYWRTLLAPWLLAVVSIVVDRRLACLAGHALAPDAGFLTCRSRGPSATADAWKKTLYTPAGHHDLLSRIVEAMDLPVREVVCQADCCLAATDPGPAPQAKPPRFSRPPRLDLATGKVVLASLLFGGQRNRRVQLIDVVSPSQALALYARVRGCRAGSRASVLAGPPPPDPSPQIDLDRRERLRSVAASTPTESLVVRLLPELMPFSLLESYQQTVAESHRIFGQPTHVIHGMSGSNEVHNEFLARCLTAGRRVAFAQHGGAYGQLKVQGGIRLERWPETQFLSWGWAGPGVVPMPSARLSRIRDQHRGGDAVAVIEGPPADQSLVNMGFTSIQFRRAAQLPQDLARFVAALDGAPCRPNLVFKPFPSIDHSTNAVELMRNARLAVVTYFDTVFHESLALNVPLVAFWDPTVYGLTDEANRRLGELARVGVIHQDPVEAAETVRSVYERADAWWSDAAIQAARLAFLDDYGSSRDWSAAWVPYLRRFAA